MTYLAARRPWTVFVHTANGAVLASTVMLYVLVGMLYYAAVLFAQVHSGLIWRLDFSTPQGFVTVGLEEAVVAVIGAGLGAVHGLLFLLFRWAADKIWPDRHFKLIPALASTVLPAVHFGFVVFYGVMDYAWQWSAALVVLSVANATYQAAGRVPPPRIQLLGPKRPTASVRP